MEEIVVSFEVFEKFTFPFIRNKEKKDVSLNLKTVVNLLFALTFFRPSSQPQARMGLVNNPTLSLKKKSQTCVFRIQYKQQGDNKQSPLNHGDRTVSLKK